MKVERDKYMQMIDGIVFGEDPRQGYFKGDTFYHPELKFQWTLPSGWAHQNTPQSVAAQSPKQDAILQLQAAGKISPEEASQKLFSQQGVQVGPAREREGRRRRPLLHGADPAGRDRGGGRVRLPPGHHLHAGGLFAARRLRGLQQPPSCNRWAPSAISPTPSALNVKPATLKVVRIDQPMSRRPTSTPDIPRP